MNLTMPPIMPNAIYPAYVPSGFPPAAPMPYSPTPYPMVSSMPYPPMPYSAIPYPMVTPAPLAYPQPVPVLTQGPIWQMPPQAPPQAPGFTPVSPGFTPFQNWPQPTDTVALSQPPLPSSPAVTVTDDVQAVPSADGSPNAKAPGLIKGGQPTKAVGSKAADAETKATPAPVPAPKSERLGNLIGRWAAHQFEQYPDIVNQLPDEVFKIDPERLKPEDLQELGTSIGAEIFTKKLESGPAPMRWLARKVFFPTVKKMLPGRNFSELVNKGLSSGNAIASAGKALDAVSDGPDLGALMQQLSALG